MTDNEIIKALECCLSDDPPCYRCKYDADTITVDECMSKLMKDALDLINRQNAEIERLCVELDEVIIAKDLLFDEAEALIKKAKAEAVKEFAERFERYLLSQLTSAPLDKKEWINFCLDELDNLKKEMVGADGD